MSRGSISSAKLASRADAESAGSYQKRSFRRWTGLALATSCLVPAGAALAQSAPPSPLPAAASACEQALAAAHVDLSPPGASVLMLMSPRMPWALPEWRRMAATARAAGLQVITLRDARVPLAEWRAATAAARLPELADVPPLASAAAQACGLLNHAPTSLVAGCGRVHPWPVWGVMPDAAWRHVLQARRQQLETVPCA